MNRRSLPLCAALALLLAAPAARALPQFAVQSARACDTCHVEPVDWLNPDLPERKCALNCGVCHVNPTGGGMRNESGLFYGRQTLPMWGDRPADQAYVTPTLAASRPASRPASQPASRPTDPASQPASEGAPPPAPVAYAYAPPPGSAGRYAGIEPHPTFQVGADLRLLLFHPLGEDEETAFFPMQTDLYLAARPYNPDALNEGRVTLLVNTGFLGSRGQEFDGFAERWFVREWWAMYHDLPYQAYVRAGRFLPAFGWKLADHTSFIRQGQLFLGQPFDHERQVTGVEIGANPNYPYFHLSVFNTADEWDRPMDPDDGWGAALSAGYRELFWQVGGSAMYGSRDDLDQVLGSVQWALNFHVPGWLPLIYLGEYVVNHARPAAGEPQTGLAAFHELDWLLTRGLIAHLRYDWQDTDVTLKFDSRHRATVGLEWHPYTYLEILGQYRHNWRHTEDRFASDADEILLQLHGWF